MKTFALALGPTLAATSGGSERGTAHFRDVAIQDAKIL